MLLTKLWDLLTLGKSLQKEIINTNHKVKSKTNQPTKQTKNPKAPKCFLQQQRTSVSRKYTPQLPAPVTVSRLQGCLQCIACLSPQREFCSEREPGACLLHTRFCETLRRSSGEPSTKKGCWQFHPWSRHLGAGQLKGDSTPSLPPPHGVLFALISKCTTQTTHSTSILVFKELVENNL